MNAEHSLIPLVIRCPECYQVFGPPTPNNVALWQQHREFDHREEEQKEAAE